MAVPTHELDDYDVVDDDGHEEFWHRVAVDCTERVFVPFCSQTS